MIRWLALWHLQQTFDGRDEVPGWVRRRLERDPELARRWRRLAELDAVLHGQAKLAVAPRESGVTHPTPWLRYLATIGVFVLLAASIAAVVNRTSRPPKQHWVTANLSRQAPPPRKDLKVVAASTGATLQRITSRWRKAWKEKPRWDQYEDKLINDRDQLLNSLGRLAKSVSVKPIKKAER